MTNRSAGKEVRCCQAEFLFGKKPPKTREVRPRSDQNGRISENATLIETWDVQNYVFEAENWTNNKKSCKAGSNHKRSKLAQESAPKS